MDTTSHGTCGACFKAHALDKSGRVKRHGWREQWGTRRVGEYGNVQHSSACFGTGWLPFEASPDCTRAFVERVLFHAACRLGAALDTLAANPPLLYSGITYMMRRTMPHEGEWQVTLRPGDEAHYNKAWRCGVLVDDTGSAMPSYAAKNAALVSEAQEECAAVAAHALYCLSRVEAWAPAELTVVTAAKKGPLLHAVGYKGILAACGRRIIGFTGTSTLRIARAADGVTCPKCLAKLSAATTA